MLPLLLPWVPEVDGFELDDPVFGDPLFDDPVFGAEPEAPFAVPGMVPHCEPVGDVPGLFGLLGFTVEGWVVFPVAEGLVGFEPGALVFGVPLDEEDPGLVCPGAVCGVVAPVGGFTAPVGGAVGEPGVELCPVLLEPPAGRAPPAELWATAQLAQHNTTDSNVRLRDDMSKASRNFKLFQPPSDASELTILTGVENPSNAGFSMSTHQSWRESGVCLRWGRQDRGSLAAMRRVAHLQMHSPMRFVANGSAKQPDFSGNRSGRYKPSL